MSTSPYGDQPAAYPSAPVGYEQAPVRRGAGMATASLVLGILALVTSFTVIGGILLGLLALIFGIVGVRRARVSADGRGRAIAGIITGVIGLVIAVALVAIGASILNSPAGKNLRNCLNNAHGDQTAVQQCQQQYQNSN